MKDYSLQYARELLNHLESYLKEIEYKAPKTNWITDFTRWINNFIEKKDIAEKHSGSGMEDILIGMHLVKMSNLLKKEQNRFASETPFSSFMDFQYLFVLNEHGDMTKSQLIFSNNMEMSSGIEVVNRLSKQGWIEEKENPKDRRSKLVSVSDDGRSTLERHRVRGLQIYKSYSTDLDNNEKMLLLELLGNMNLLNT